jgi:hypothetical protein
MAKARKLTKGEKEFIDNELKYMGPGEPMKGEKK